MKTEAVTIITSIIQGGALLTFFLLTIRGLKNQIKSLELRNTEIDKVVHMYKSMINDLPQQIENFKTIIGGLKDEQITQLKNAISESEKKNEYQGLLTTLEKIETNLAEIDRFKHYYDATDKYAYIERHKGWHPKDISIDKRISERSLFKAHVKLLVATQDFTIYLKVTTFEGGSYWLGFGNGNDKIHKGKTEYKKLQNLNKQEYFFHENIDLLFKERFPEVKSSVREVNVIRLRGSDKIMEEIEFSFSIE